MNIMHISVTGYEESEIVKFMNEVLECNYNSLETFCSYTDYYINGCNNDDCEEAYTQNHHVIGCDIYSHKKCCDKTIAYDKLEKKFLILEDFFGEDFDISKIDRKKYDTLEYFLVFQCPDCGLVCYNIE